MPYFATSSGGVLCDIRRTGDYRGTGVRPLLVLPRNDAGTAL